MNWFSKLFASAKSIIAEWAKRRALQLSQLDGNPGLSPADFELLVSKVQEKSLSTAKGIQKHQQVVDWMDNALGHKVPKILIGAIVVKAYDYAQGKGLLPQ